MGSHYRNREGRRPPAHTTTADLAGLTSTKPNQLLDNMTKDQLLELAANKDVDVKANMNKADIRLAITKHHT